LSFWSNKRTLVTGGAGFLGSFVVEKLQARGCQHIFVPRRTDYDLTQIEAVRRVYREAKPDIVIHLAAVVGGIGANRKNPGKFFYENASWDTTRPNGQPRRALDTAKAERLFGFKARMPLEQGLKRTIAWYKENCL
jgi:nucleoside-diphosphate-sugar epimerase